MIRHAQVEGRSAMVADLPGGYIKVLFDDNGEMRIGKPLAKPILFFRKAHEQLSLFDVPVNVPGSVKKDGTVVKPYTRVQKKRAKPAPADRARIDRARAAVAATSSLPEHKLPVEGPPPVPPPKPKAPKVTTIKLTEAQKSVMEINVLDPVQDDPIEPHVALLREYYDHKKGVLRVPADKVQEIRDALIEVINTEDDQAEREKDKLARGARTAAQNLHDKVKAPPPEPEPPVDEPPPPVTIAQFGAAGESKDERKRINAAVVDLITADKTEYTGEDKQLMARYSGNGGCGASLNEFYTDPAVASAMWTAVERMGVPGGTALEPSCGAGVFLHTAPPTMKVTGVEIDGVSAKVAAALHPGHEIREASLELFAIGDERQFDAVIGNAPFGVRGGTLKDDKPEISTADCYFIDTSIDKARPGGIVAMIVNHGVMDTARDYKMRKRFLNKAEFLGAIRMPNTAFEHSHTEVTADIVFFKKRPQDVANALGVLTDAERESLGLKDEEYLNGGYFEGRGAGNILGSVEPGWRAKAGMGNDITVAGSMVGVPERIAQFEPDEAPRAAPTMEDILAAVAHDPKRTARVLGAAVKRPYELIKPGSTKTVDGIQYILEGNPLRWHRLDEVMDRAAVTDAEDIAASIAAILANPEAYTAADREEVAAAVRAYVTAHGVPSKNHDLLVAAHQNRALYNLIGAVGNDGTLSDILTKEPEPVEKSSFETAAQTLAAEREAGLFTPEDVATRTGKSLEDVNDLLHASNEYAYDAESGKWTTMSVYLTGELWPKLDAVAAALARPDIDPGLRVKYELQQAKLFAKIDPKSMEEMDIELNNAFIPLPILEAYFNQRRDESEFDHIRKSADWKITFDSGLYNIEGGDTQGRRLLEHYLNRHHVNEDDWDLLKTMNKDFKDWLMSSRFRDEVETRHNRAFRGYVKPTFTNDKIDIPGMATEGLKDYQYGGVRWALAHGKGIIAADVGLGKTVRALMIARLMKLEGKAKRNMIVVPKSVVGNWAKEAEKWFPGSKVLVIGESVNSKGVGKADNADARNKKYHQYMQNDYDFVFITQPAFNKLDVDPIVKGEYLEKEFWVQRGDAMAAKSPKNKKALRQAAMTGVPAETREVGDKRIKKIRENYAAEMARRQHSGRSDAIYFNDMGVDLLMADEAHVNKNLYGIRDRFGKKPKFLGGGGKSDTALDMHTKASFIRDTHGGKGVFFMTATPTKNSPLEIYSMLAHIAPEEFERLGIRNSEEFLDRFCEQAVGPCLTTDASIEDSPYVSGFKNMGELRTVMSRYIDRTTAADVGLVLPARDDKLHLIDMTPQQTAVYEDLRAQARAAAEKEGGDPESHIFSIMAKMAKAAVDLELLDPVKYKGAKSPKIDAMADLVSTNVQHGGQIVFCEHIQLHQKMKDALVAKGIPADQIAIFNAEEAETGQERQDIQDDFNSGKVKVVIGNKTMEQGVNLQVGGADLLHLDIAWEPATMQQRVGRILRQGNKNKSVRIHTLLSKGSFDGYRYQAMMGKKSWQDLIWSGADKVENLERPTVTSDEMMIMMSADPDAERIKMEGNKQLAQARYLAEKTSQASTDFEQYQLMKHNLAKLRNKTSEAAGLLMSKIKRARAKLIDSPHFHQKAALESPNVVMLHPETGTILQHGAGIERDGKKYVVVGVDPTQRTATLRTYGGVGATAHILTLPIADIGPHVKPFEYDEAAETAHMSKEFGEYVDNGEGAGRLDMEAVRHLPAAVLHANAKKIQARLKRNMAEYKLSAYRGAPFLVTAGSGSHAHGDNEGDAKVSKSHDARELAARDDHDLMLPTPENRERMFAEYAKAEQAREHRAGEYHAKSRTTGPMLAKYQQNPKESYHGLDSNPWGGAGEWVFGEGFRKQAHAAFLKKQSEHVRHAKDFTEAVRRAAPTIEMGYAGHKWPHSTLAVLFARAKRDKILDQPLADVLPKRGQTTQAESVPTWDGLGPKPGGLVAIDHNTYANRAALKQMGGTWNGPKKAWMVPAHRADEAWALVGGKPTAPARQGRDELPADLWKSKPQGNAYTTNDVRQQAVLPALITLAKDSGYNDLAAAMIVSARPPLDAAKELVQLPLSDEHVIAAVEHLAGKHPELAATPVLDLFGGEEYNMRRSVGTGREDLKFGELAKEMRVIHAGEARVRAAFHESEAA